MKVKAGRADWETVTTDYYDVVRFGNYTFTGLPVDASKKMPDNLMDSLEPFDYGELKSFSAAYLPGFMADRYDVSVKNSLKRADKRCKETACKLMRDAASPGYTRLSAQSEAVYIERGRVHYALLPVWTVKIAWEGKSYLFAMNGQTGKFVGNLPVSKAVYWQTIIVAATILSLIVYFSGLTFYLALIVLAIVGLLLLL